MNFFFFFFSSRRRNTRWPRDWSSDVCSSDLDDEVVTEQLVLGWVRPVAGHVHRRQRGRQLGVAPELRVVAEGATEQDELGQGQGPVRLARGSRAPPQHTPL